MAPAYGPYQSLEDYLQHRARDHGHNLTGLSQHLGYGRSYLSSIATGHFRPSVKRCREIAAFFKDDPDIILTLAGFRGEQIDGDSTIAAIGRIVNSLSPPLQQTVLDLAAFLNSRQAARQAGLKSSQIYVELSDGQGMTLDINGDLSTLSTEAVRLTIRAALNAAVAGEQAARARKAAKAESDE